MFSWFGKKKQNGGKFGGGVDVRTAAHQPPTPRKPGAMPIGGALPRFRSTAGDQIDLRRADPVADVRMRLRSAFTPAQPMSDRQVFAGRIEILKSLIRAVEDTHLHVVLYGQRGLGKTSILHVFSQAARDARYIVVYAPCDARSTFDEVFRSVAAKIPLLYHGGVDPTAPESERGKTLADILPSEPLTSRTISDALANVVGTRVIIVLDEFDRSESQAFRHGIAELLKNLSDRSVRVQMVIAGVAADLAELVEYIPSVQRNIFVLQLPRLTNDEVQQLVKNGATAAGLNFDESAIAAIVFISNGFPYFASLISHYAALHVLDNNRITVGNDDVLAAVRDSLEGLAGRVPRRMLVEIGQFAEQNELLLMVRLAGVALLSGGQIDAELIRQHVSEPDVATQCFKLVERLLTKNILVKRSEDASGNSYRFADANLVPYVWFRAAEAGFRLPAGSPRSLRAST